MQPPMTTIRTRSRSTPPAPKPARKWHVTARRKLQAAQAIVDEGSTPTEVAKRFVAPPSVNELRAWADEYKASGEAGFLTKHGGKRVAGSSTLTSLSYDRLPVMLRQEVTRLRALKQQTEAQLALTVKQLEKAERHLTFVEGEQTGS